jgi:hypothetical protein
MLLNRLILAIGLVLAAPRAFAQRCAIEARPLVLETSGNTHAVGARLAQVWEVDAAPVFWTTQPPATGSYPAFVAALRASGVDTNPVSLLRRKAALPETSSGDARNDSLLARESSDWIHPINCLEMLLIGIQHERIDLLRQSTEFVAFVLRSSDGRRLRIYYYTRNEDGIGSVGAILAPVARDSRDGWIVIANLHNHNFRVGQPDLNAVVSPSLPDAQLYQTLATSYQLREAWITNGLHTARIPASAFGRLQAAR